jgi:hypothetical protein
MKLLEQFIQICLLKKSPADLPASPAVLKLTLLLAFVISTLASLEDYGLTASAVSSLADMVLMMVTCWVLLSVKGFPERYIQTVMAMAGSGIVINTLALPVVWAYGQFDASGQIASIVLMLLVFILIWSLIIISQIFRLSLEISAGQATVITLIYATITYLVIGLTLSGVA